MGPRAGLDRCRKSRPPTGIRSPDRPARGESLYRLSRRGPKYNFRLSLLTDMMYDCIFRRKLAIMWSITDSYGFRYMEYNVFKLAARLKILLNQNVLFLL